MDGLETVTDEGKFDEMPYPGEAFLLRGDNFFVYRHIYTPDDVHEEVFATAGLAPFVRKRACAHSEETASPMAKRRELWEESRFAADHYSSDEDYDSRDDSDIDSNGEQRTPGSR